MKKTIKAADNAVAKPVKAFRDPVGRFLPGHAVGLTTRWQHGSGNPAGTPVGRREFERAFYSALVNEGTPDEAAKLLWKCARNLEPWAMQLLLQRVAPPEARIRHTTEAPKNATYDLSQLTATELETFTQLALRAATGGDTAATALVEGESSPILP